MTTYKDTHTHDTQTADGIATYTTTYLRTYCDTDVHTDLFTGTIWTIPTGTNLIDGGAAPYNAVMPGDIIELAPGTRDRLTIRDLTGSAAKPIVIRNGDGVVVVNTVSENGIQIYNCHYFQLTGSGYGQSYGIDITRSLTNGIWFGYKTDEFEFDHIQIDRVDHTAPAYSIGIQGQTNTTSSPNYDYDLDGDVDADDGIVTRANYTAHNYHIHHCLIDGGLGTNLIDMGMYLGNANYIDGDGGVFYPVIHGMYVHDNIVQNITHKGIKMGSVTENCYCYNNTLTNINQSTYVAAGKSGIELNSGCFNAIVYNNKIIDSPHGFGINPRCEGLLCYNNLLVRCGDPATSYNAGISVNYVAGYTHGNNSYIFNNTIIDAANNGIEFTYGYGTNLIQNNIIVNPGGSYVSHPAGTFTHDYNLETMDIADCDFTDEANDDYYLLTTSPAKDAGIDTGIYGVNDDIVGTARPQGVAYDEGAYEFV